MKATRSHVLDLKSIVLILKSSYLNFFFFSLYSSSKSTLHKLHGINDQIFLKIKIKIKKFSKAIIFILVFLLFGI
jgi:hypothetical protein